MILSFDTFSQSSIQRHIRTISQYTCQDHRLDKSPPDSCQSQESLFLFKKKMHTETKKIYVCVHDVSVMNYCCCFSVSCRIPAYRQRTCSLCRRSFSFRSQIFPSRSLTNREVIQLEHIRHVQIIYHHASEQKQKKKNDPAAVIVLTVVGREVCGSITGTSACSVIECHRNVAAARFLKRNLCTHGGT